MRAPSKTREKLLETAIELVWQSNYCSVGVMEICKRAGVTKGAFYHHFESKADLFYAAAQHHWEATKGDLDAVFSPAVNPLDQIENLIDYVLDGHEEVARSFMTEADGEALEVAGCPFFSAGGQVGLQEEKVRQAAVEIADKSIVYGSTFVRGLKSGGYLNGDADPAQVGRMIFTFVQGLMIFGRTRNSRAAVAADLRDGLYRILDLKEEFRRPAGAEGVETAAPPVETET